MDGATKQISEYIRKKGFNLSEISRKTGVPYMALYDSVANEKRDRDLRVDEFLALCKHLELDPIIFYPTDTENRWTINVSRSKNKNTDGTAISTSILPNLFTLCILQVFTTSDSGKCFYEILCHFRSFGSATCLIADKW